MNYREVNYDIKKPKLLGNWYFYKSLWSGHTYGLYNGNVGHMESHKERHPDNTIVWLEPESEYNPDEYYSRISKLDIGVSEYDLINNNKMNKKEKELLKTAPDKPTKTALHLAIIDKIDQLKEQKAKSVFPLTVHIQDDIELLEQLLQKVGL